VLADDRHDPGSDGSPPLADCETHPGFDAPPSLVLDALIAKLKTYLPEDPAAAPSRSGLKIPFVPLPTARKER
jgi:hypothetical protein